MKKRLLCALITICVVLSVAPMQVSAAGTVSIYIAGNEINDGDYYITRYNAGNNNEPTKGNKDDWSIHREGDTLYFKGVSLISHDTQAIRIEGPYGTEKAQVRIVALESSDGPSAFAATGSSASALSARRCTVTIDAPGTLGFIGFTFADLICNSGTIVFNDLSNGSTGSIIFNGANVTADSIGLAHPAGSEDTMGAELIIRGGSVTATRGFSVKPKIEMDYFGYKTAENNPYEISMIGFNFVKGQYLSIREAQGPNTPQLRINDETNEWEVSYDKGENWSSLGVKATGDKGADGKDGKDGINGADGKDGKDGINGINGKTPRVRINPETNIWEVSYDDTDEWKSLEIKATGDRGADGDTPYIGENGNWWIANSDTGVKAEGIDGKDGANGSSGKNGVNGLNGTGISAVSINDNGELVVTMSDGSEKNLGKVAGADGKDGVSITAVSLDEKGGTLVKLSDGTSINVGDLNASGTPQNDNLKVLIIIALVVAALSLAGTVVTVAYTASKRKKA